MPNSKEIVKRCRKFVASLGDITSKIDADCSSEMKQLLDLVPSAPSHSFLKRQNPITISLSQACTEKRLSLRSRVNAMWDSACFQEVVEILSGSGMRTALTLEQFQRSVNDIQRYLRSERPELESLQKMVQSRYFPEVSLMLFHRGAVEGKITVDKVVSGLMTRMSLFRLESDLLAFAMPDDRVTMEDLERFFSAGIDDMASPSRLPRELHPHYVCVATRRIAWALDPMGTGRVSVAGILGNDSIGVAFAKVRLGTEDPSQNWFSFTMVKHVHEKYLDLALGETTISVEKLLLYKRGVPSIKKDGLPATVSPLSSLFIKRVFEVTALHESRMDFHSFTEFCILVESFPSCPRAAYLWQLVDLTDSGVLTPITVNFFFRETHAKLVGANVQVPAMEVVVQELFDLIPTAEPLRITRAEFLRAPQNGLFVALMVDCLQFFAYEGRYSM